MVRTVEVELMEIGEALASRIKETTFNIEFFSNL